MTENKKPVIYVCGYCGSDNVQRLGDTAWCVQTQQWELVTVYDSATCEACECGTRLVEKEYDDAMENQ
jgi:DNA-directed RNA polymerase subunit RPC12/RpoP